MPPLLILQEIASRYESDKSLRTGSFRAGETFQLIGGVGDGGLLAFMLGHFGMGVAETIREYRRILEAIHQHSDTAGWSKDERSQKFETALKALVASKTSPSDENLPLTKPRGEDSGCKVFVTAMHALNLQHPVLLRTYRSRNDANPPPCTLVEAIRATTAMPDLFIPVPLGPPHRQINHVSPACHGFNNPIDQVRQEAKAVFPRRTIACIISLGCGHPGPIQIQDVKEDAARAVVQLAMDSVRAAEQTYCRLAGIPNLYFRFDVPYGLERAVLKLNPAFSEIQAHISAYIRQEQTSDTIDSVVKQLVELPPLIKPSELDGLLPIEAATTVWVKKCPLPSLNFTGRRAELDHMHTYFSSAVGSSSHIYVLYGLGGSGKTQLLLQFVLECQNQYPQMFDVVFFVDASLETTVEADLKAIAISRNVGETAADAVQWLSYQTNRWLLIFDNADDKTFSIQKYIPNSIHGNVIITSRNPELAGMTSRDLATGRIGDLEKSTAEELLRKLVRPRGAFPDSDDLLITQVAEMLNCFALAVTQAGSYMSATSCGCQEYIELFQKERPRLLRERHGHVPDNYPWSVYTTWAISFNQLKTAPRHFMQICSYLHYTGIPKDLFMCAAESEPLTDVDEGAQVWLSEFMNHTRNEEGLWKPVAFDELVQNVMSFSLVDYDPETRLFSFHPLVHEWTREAIQSAYGQDFPNVECALQLVALSSPGTNDRSSTSIILKRLLLTHLDALVSGAVHVSSVPMALRLSAIYEQTGRWHDVANIFERAKEIGGYGGNWTIDACTSVLASAYGHLGKQAEALELQISVFESQTQTLGDDHPNVLLCVNNIASTYHALGWHAEALNMRLSLLDNQKRILGDEHPDTLTNMNNVASTYRALGRHPEALDLDRSLLANRKRILGDEHPDTMTSMNNLASTYVHLGMHADALELQLSVLANDKRTLGDEHPHTLSSMNNLASTYQACGKLVETLDLQVSVLAIRKKNLGDEHPDTILTMNNLASTYFQLGNHAEALDLQLSVLAQQAQSLGDEHPRTLSSIINLATTYRALGMRSEATDLLIPAVSAATRVFGANHPTAVTLQRALEFSLMLDSGEVGDDSSGEELASITATISKYEREGRWEEVIEQQEIAVEAFSAMLGECHPKTVQTVYSLASNFLRLSRTDDARPHIERAYRLVNDDTFPSNGHLDLVQKIEQLHTQYCLNSSPGGQVDRTELLTATETQTGEKSMPVVEDERSPQAKAADAAEARRTWLNASPKNKKDVMDNTAAYTSTHATEAEKSQNTSAAPPVANLATSQTAADAPTSSQKTLTKGKARDLPSIPNDQDERIASVAPVGNPLADQQNVDVVSSTLETKQHTMVDVQEPDVNIPSNLDVASTSSAPLLPEANTQVEEGESASSHAINQDLRGVVSEDEAHKRYMAKMELKRMKVQAKSEKQQRQCRLEVARMVLFALVILGIQWRDTKKT
ncbi:hypothetical protein DL96DRAFT_1815811 [Flagelloscypha sp. PMI_526]|nr:hypothetical protein DL96DRAFT_1815811 [Flagelloscypha sp. PMI_526]